jgi:hypothetical protein
VSATNKHPDEIRIKAFKPIKKSRLHDSSKQKGLNQTVNRNKVSMVTDMSTSLMSSATADVMSFINKINSTGYGYGGSNIVAAHPDTTLAHQDAGEDIEEFD